MSKPNGARLSVGRVVQHLRYLRRQRAFVRSDADGLSKSERQILIKKFALIDKYIPSGHSPGELFFICQKILGLKIDGPIVECGTYKGASAAKLSLVAKLMRRELFICDSFMGLPERTEGQIYHRTDNAFRRFEPGEYEGSLEEVRHNIGMWGALESCRFVEGLFSETLPTLQVGPALVFMDVDYVSSARDCLVHLWPQLLASGYFFTHEAQFVEFVRGICDSQWWHDNLGECPPILYGAGYGVDTTLAPYLAYFEKGD